MDKLINNEVEASLPKFPKSEKIKHGTDGWLSPRGDYYEVGSTQHDESATFLVVNSPEVRDGERRKFTHSYERGDYDDKNDREKLKELGWILIRGKVLRSEDALNFTPAQLRSISEAGIIVISAFDGSTEYSSAEVQAILKNVFLGLDNSKIILSVREDLEKGKLSPWWTEIRQKTFSDIDRFEENPFHTSIYTAEVHDWRHPNEHEILPSEIFDIMSQGSSEEMKMLLGRSEFYFRVINLETGGKIWVEREKYFHDGLSGGMAGDINNYISMYVIDDVLASERLVNLIKHRRNMLEPPKITFQVIDGYFENFFSTIIKKANLSQ